jgi:hypothetical protein
MKPYDMAKILVATIDSRADASSKALGFEVDKYASRAGGLESMLTYALHVMGEKRASEFLETFVESK